jgi:ABC-type phosphate transport system auxiliary subunit
MGSDEDKAAIADLKARLGILEKDVEDIKTEYKTVRQEAQEAALRERDLMGAIKELNTKMDLHIQMHEDSSKKKISNAELIFVAINALTGIGVVIVSIVK